MFRRGDRPKASVEEVPVASSATEGLDDLSELLSAIESLAMQIYDRHGLPSVPGHYRRLNEDEAWELVAVGLSPAQKFDLILQQGTATQWQYAAYDRLGARHGSAEVRHASALLGACNGIRIRLDTGEALTPQVLADAMRLGVSYQSLARSLPLRGKVPDLLSIRPPLPSGSQP